MAKKKRAEIRSGVVPPPFKATKELDGFAGLLSAARDGEEPYARAHVMAHELLGLAQLLPMRAQFGDDAGLALRARSVDRMWEVFVEHRGSPVNWMDMVDLFARRPGVAPPRHRFPSDEAMRHFVLAVEGWNDRDKRGPRRGGGVGAWDRVVSLLRAVGHDLPADRQAAKDAVRSMYATATGTKKPGKRREVASAVVAITGARAP